MRIALFGATGKAGGAILREALERGHEVRALVRRPEELEVRHPNLDVVRGGFEDADALHEVLEGADAAITAIGVTSRKRPTLLVDSVTAIRAGMRRTGARRLVVVQGVHMAAPGDPRNIGLRLIELVLRAAMRPLTRDARRLGAVLRADDGDWTVVRMPRLTVAPATGEAWAGTLLVSWLKHVTSGDVAVVAMHCLEQDAWVRQMPMVVSGSVRAAGRAERVAGARAEVAR